MKCTNCGHELEPGSGFCENCGTIMSLDSDFEESIETDSIDIFSGSEPVDNEAEFNRSEADDYEQAKELEIDETEQVVESEAVSDDEAIAGVSYSDYDADEEENLQEESGEGSSEEEHSHEEHSYEDDVDNPFDAAQEDYDENDDTEQDSHDNESDEDDSLDDMYIRSRRTEKGGAIIAVMVVFLIVIVAVGANVIRNNFFTKPETSVNAGTSDSNVSDPTKTQTPTTDKKDSTDKETSDESTEKVTDESETATSEKATDETTSQIVDVTDEPATTTRQIPTTAADTTKPTAQQTTSRPATTSRPTTTSPRTTAPKTTSKPSTTAKPSTTSPKTSAEKTTKAPSTTADPYGFNFATVEKPKKYLQNSYKVYVTTNALSLRAEPDSKSERIVYLPIGTSCTVYSAKENGFVYVRSDRYGVYGWVATAYVSESRPESNTTTIVPNLVSPDKKYDKAQVKYVNDSEGLRLRKGPGTSYDIITRIDNGFPVKVIGYNSDVSGWVYVLDTTHGIYGWVSSAYIK